MISYLPPGFLLGLLLSALYAGLFHVWGGRTLRDLFIYVVAAIVGFALGQGIGMLIKLPLPHIGQVYIIEASLVSWLCMIGVHELGVGQPRSEIDRY